MNFGYVHLNVCKGRKSQYGRDKDGFGFTNNNFAAPGYPYPGIVIRIGCIGVLLIDS